MNTVSCSRKIRENKLFEALQIKSNRHHQLQLDVQRHIHYEQLEVFASTLILLLLENFYMIRV